MPTAQLLAIVSDWHWILLPFPGAVDITVDSVGATRSV
jgi:hypothetical protein